MIRKLAFALSLLGACFTGLVHALGLGEATVQSSLNQPLTAEIELVNVSGLGIDEILPGLATREEFLRAKVDRVYFLSDLRFKVQKNEKGNLAVILTTTKPVREPFLNFLVEVIWPSGRLLREYALLIDPPLFSEKKAAPVQSPSISNVPNQTVVSGDVLKVSEPTQSVTSVATSGQGGGTYGATNSQDTLWDIAIKARPDRSVTPQQVMLSIQDLNPGAFINQNINKLKAGQVLRLPTLEQIKQRNRSQAIIEVIAQNEADRPKRTKSIASTTKRSEASKTETVGTSGDELKLVVASNQSTVSNTANSGQSTEAGNGRAEPNNEMLVTLEKLDKAALENTELTGRVTDLEEQLETLQRILALKNDQLAGIQSQMRASELAKLEAAPDETANEEQSTQNVENNVAVTSVTEKSTLENVADKADAGKADELKKTEQLALAEKAKIAAEKAVPATQPEISVPVTHKESIFETIASNPLYQGLLGLGIIILLIVLWLVSRNNAQKEQEYYAQNTSDDDLLEEGEDENLEFETESADSEQDNDEEESENLEDFLAQDDEEYASEVESSAQQQEGESEDVIAEADVYIAYGRLDQAASILESAISADPVRTDYRLKLLEVYKDSNDVDAFNRQFSELEAIQDTAAIDEAALIRTELLENELVSLETKEQELADSRQLEEQLESQSEQEAALEAEEEAIENDAQSFDFDSVEGNADDSEAENLDIDFSSEDLELDLDVDLDLAQEGELAPEEASELELGEDVADFTAELESNDVDELLGEDSSLLSEDDNLLAGDDLLSESTELLSENDLEIDQPLTEKDVQDLELDDIDLSGELDQETEIDLSDDLTSDLSGSVDLSVAEDLSIDEELSGADVLSLSEEPLTEEAPSLDVEGESVISDAILDEAVEAFGSAEDIGDDLGDSDDFDFLEGTDEASTKLDLARAYIDMGDIDGAKDILEEVTKEGSDEQQTEAKDLLGSLDS